MFRSQRAYTYLEISLYIKFKWIFRNFSKPKKLQILWNSTFLNTYKVAVWQSGLFLLHTSNIPLRICLFIHLYVYEDCVVFATIGTTEVSSAMCFKRFLLITSCFHGQTCSQGDQYTRSSLIIFLTCDSNFVFKD